MTTSCLKCFIASVLGAIVLFGWGYVSWMVLPWHHMALKSFKDDAAVVQVLKDNVNESGAYSSPSLDNKEMTDKPRIFANVDLKGVSSDSMTKPMIISFIIQLVTALLVTWLLSNTSGLSYLRRVGFVFVFALAAAIVTSLPAWNWFGFDVMYTLINMADLVIAWFLAGIIIAAIVSGKKAHY